MNWNDLQSRLAYLEAHGADAYNEAMARHVGDSMVEIVNGHAIRVIESDRWGTVYMVGTTGTGYPTLERAREFARSVSP